MSKIMKETAVEMKRKRHLLQSSKVSWYGMTLLTVAGVYVGTGRLGLSLGAANGFATLVWLPSGLAVTAMFLWGFRLWPAIILGAFLTNLITGAPVPVAIGISIGNTLEAAVCTTILKHARVRPALNTLHDVLTLVLLAVPPGTLISATLGGGSLWLGGIIAWSSVPMTWCTWWFGDTMSLLLLPPFLFTWSAHSLAVPCGKRLLELGLLSACVLVIGLFVFLGLFPPRHWAYPVTHLVFPPLIWAALRFGSRGATAAIATFAGFAIVGTIHGISPFSTGNLWLRLLLLQSFLGIMATTTLILATIVAERHALEQRKDDFITLASHELRTPLACLLGYTQLLRKRLTGFDHLHVQTTLMSIETQAKRFSRLITDLFDLSKIKAGQLTFVEESVDMNTLVLEVVEQLQQTSQEHQIRIEGSVSGTIVGDQMRLAQVLYNLLANAMKYSPQAQQIIVRLTSGAEGLTVSIQDFGIGIPKAEQKRIFERFYRASSEQSRTTAGLGIGLFITHQIIQHYRGKLWVESMEGQGSTFSFSLPLLTIGERDSQRTLTGNNLVPKGR
jgi:signal transduction histidine kinase